jgi:hypothetical protein
MGQYDRMFGKEPCEYREPNEYDNKKNEQLNKNINEYIHFIYEIKHNEFIPIKHAINKYRKQLNKPLKRPLCIGRTDNGNSDIWVLSGIMRLSKLLLIDKVKNKWVCSKDRLEMFDFNKFDIHILGNFLNK